MESPSRANSTCGRQVGQGGFTLLELLVVIAILGILGGVAVFSMGNLRTKAENTALDESLRTVSTATQAKMIMDNLSLEQAVTPALSDLINSKGTEFATVASSKAAVVIQARPTGKQTPCRQMDLASSQPVTCAGSVAVSRLIFSAAMDPARSQVAWNNSVARTGWWNVRFWLENRGDEDLTYTLRFTKISHTGATTVATDNNVKVLKRSARTYIASSGPGALGTINASRSASGTVSGTVKLKAEIISVRRTTGTPLSAPVTGQEAIANHPPF